MRDGDCFRKYYHFACFICLETKNVKQCAHCKIISYCSKEHQIEDWPYHKDLCKAIRRTNEKMPKKEKMSFVEWRDYRLKLKVSWEASMKRPLAPYEDTIWMFPRACVICYTTNNLKNCSNCQCVSYCSEDHRKKGEDKHILQCESYRNCFDIDWFLMQQDLFPNVFVRLIEDEIQDIPRNLFELTELFDEDFETEIYIDPTMTQHRMFCALKCESVDTAGIILFAINKSYSTEPRTYFKKTMTIHVVGANQVEFDKDWGSISEILLHWYQNLEFIRFIFVGPEVEKDFFDNNHYKDSLCGKCEDEEKKFTLIPHEKCYHEIFNNLRKPDIVLALNCGLHEFENDKRDTWKASLHLLVHYPNVPLVITSYTDIEMERDLNRMKSLNTNCEFVVENEENLLCSLRPFRDWLSENEPFYYHNRYISILRKT